MSRTRKTKPRRRVRQLRGPAPNTGASRQFKTHISAAHARLIAAEDAARHGECAQVIRNLVEAGTEHGIAMAHARGVSAPILARRVKNKLNLLVDTIGQACTRPRR